MRKTIYAFIGALVVLGSLAAASVALEGDRIAYVNSEVLINKMVEEMPEFRLKFQKLEELSKQYEAQLELMKKEYDEKLKSFEANEKLGASHPEKWSQFIRELKLKEIIDLENRIKNTQQYLQYDLADRQNKLYLPVVKKYKEVVEQVAKENGYTVVVEFNGVIYAPADRKLTSKVAQKLGVNYNESEDDFDGFGMNNDGIQGAGQ